MKKDKVRVLGRKMSKFLSEGDLQSLAGRGTSFYGTGSIDSAGRAQDIEAGDCVDGQDVYHPYH